MQYHAQRFDRRGVKLFGGEKMRRHFFLISCLKWTLTSSTVTHPYIVTEKVYCYLSLLFREDSCYTQFQQTIQFLNKIFYIKSKVSYSILHFYVFTQKRIYFPEIKIQMLKIELNCKIENTF